MVAENSDLITLKDIRQKPPSFYCYSCGQRLTSHYTFNFYTKNMNTFTQFPHTSTESDSH